MRTVSANVCPGTGSDPSQVSDAQTSSASGKEPAPTVQPGVAPGQSAAADLGGTSTTPNEHDDDGEENPGAKAAAPISQVSGDPQKRAQGGADTQPSVGAEVQYDTSTDPAADSPHKPPFEQPDVSADHTPLS